MAMGTKTGGLKTGQTGAGMMAEICFAEGRDPVAGSFKRAIILARTMGAAVGWNSCVIGWVPTVAYVHGRTRDNGRKFCDR
jgi:hypothetical protein